MRIVVSITIWE